MTATKGGQSGTSNLRRGELSTQSLRPRSAPPSLERAPLPRSPARTATLLAVLTVLASIVVALFAYHGSRRALSEQLSRSAETLAHSVRVHSEELVADGVAPQQALQRAWTATRGAEKGLYLCFVGASGKLDVHTRHAERIGRSVSSMMAATPGETPAQVADLLREKRGWTGENLDLKGERQVVSFSYSEPLAGLVTVHVPRRVLEQHAMAGTLPWAYGMGAVTLLLLPLALWWLHNAHQRALLELAEAHAQRQALAERLNQSHQLESLGRLASGVAHDFNNLLMVILGSVDGLKEERVSPEGKEDLQDIQGAAERGSKLVKQLLTFGSRQQGAPEVLDVSEVVRGLTTLLKRLVGEGVRIDLDLGTSSHRVHADRGQLEQVVTNLVINARDAMPEGGLITVRAREVPCPDEYLPKDSECARCLCLSVQDEGVGMSPEVLARAMEPFFTTKKKQGTGLGLATAYGIAKQHGGRLTVESSENQGTTVSLYLPIVEDAVTPVAPRSEVISASGVGMHVLVVEDDERVRRSLMRCLENTGYSTKTAHDAVEARRLLATPTRFDLVVSDLVMPGQGGNELAQELLEDYPTLKILLISGYAPRAEVVHSLDPRIRFLAKPFTSAELHKKLEELMEEHADAKDPSAERTGVG